jgi:G3E family GTPase
MQTLDAHVDAVKQAAVADRVLLTKGDLAASEAIVGLHARIRALNPSARIIEVIDGRVEPSQFFSVSPYDPHAKTSDVQQWLGAEANTGNQHGHDDAHDRPHAHRHDRVQAHCVTIDKPVPRDAFLHWLELMAAMRGEQMLRVKGLISIKEQPDRPIVVHGVQNIFHPVVQLDAWPTADHRTRLVFITRDIPRELIERTLSKFAQVQPGRIAAA